MSELGQAWRTVWRWKWMIASLSVLSAVTAMVISQQLPKLYASKAVAVVTPGQVVSSNVPTNQNQVPTIDQVVATYAALINTAPVRSQLVKDGVPRTSDELAAELTIIRQPDTQLLEVTAADRDPAVAALIATNVIPAFNASLDELQQQVPSQSASARLQALLPWEVPTRPPDSPVSPNIPRNVLLATAAALTLALVFAFLLERLDNTVKVESDVRAKLGLPLLGAVVDAGVNRRGPRVGDVALVTRTHPHDAIAEQYRALRTNLLFSQVNDRIQSLVVTSAEAGEGKTTTASNLATVMAQAGNRVILVDADFRRPGLHEIFRSDGGPGLGNLILGASVDEVTADSGVPNLRVISAGPRPPNPSELLGSSNMERVLQQLVKASDMVIFDTPPISAVTDAAVLATMVDGVVVVIQRGRTRITSIARATQTLTEVHGRLLGVVLNRARASDLYHYYYDYGGDRRPEIAAET